MSSIRARHILVASEAEANELKGKIAGGEKFEDLAKCNSFGRPADDKVSSQSRYTLPAGSAAMTGLSESLAVVLIDMQEDFLMKVIQKSKDRILTNQIIIIRHCAENDIPVIVLEGDGYGPTIPLLIEEVVKVPRHEIIIKSAYSGFSNKDFESHLDDLKISSLALMGVNAGACVLLTAEDALNKGFLVKTSEEVIAASIFHNKNNHIPWYKSNGAHEPNLVASICK